MASGTEDMDSRLLPTVSVRGSGTVRAVPDEAHLVLELAASARSSDAALEEVTRDVDAIVALLERNGIGEDDRATSIRVREDRERDGTRWLSKGHHATARIDIRTSNAEPLGTVIAEAVTATGADVQGPRWTLTPEHPAWAEACAKAARAARSRAEAYADGLGQRLGEALRVVEPGVSTVSPIVPEEPLRPAAAPAARMPLRGAPPGAAPQPAPELDLRPGARDVHATVEVTFHLEPREPSEG
ncbi:MAG: SIMPL domain-containing protein [Actinobacteria bacterium]|nr:SIMPL domain-containing protein [Actinomycetota bacterium]